MWSRLERSNDYKDRLEKENTYLKSSKEQELSNMHSILEQMDISSQLRQDEQEKQIRDQEAFNKQSILEQTKKLLEKNKKG